MHRDLTVLYQQGSSLHVYTTFSHRDGDNLNRQIQGANFTNHPDNKTQVYY